MAFDPSSRSRLGRRDLSRFEGETLFCRVARVVCEAEVLPRKELYEAWEVARRARRHFRGGRVVDLASGHGLLAILMLLLDGTSEGAIAVDTRVPPSAAVLRDAFVAAWPKLEGRIDTREQDLSELPLEQGDVVVSAHACGALSDVVLARAAEAGARIAILPCCHDARESDTGGLEGWLEPALAIDATRAARLRGAGYRVRTQHIPSEITPKNRLLLASREDT